MILCGTVVMERCKICKYASDKNTRDKRKREKMQDAEKIRAEAKAESLREAADRLCKICVGELDPNTCKNCPDRSAILAVNSSTDEGEARECVWTEDTDGLWKTSCGRSWTFIEGGPKDNRVHYCHGCGKPVRISDEPNKEE